MSGYDNDCRVRPPDAPLRADAIVDRRTWMVFPGGPVVNNVRRLHPHEPAFDGLWEAWDAEGNCLGVEGSFDAVVHALIGDPR